MPLDTARALEHLLANPPKNGRNGKDGRDGLDGRHGLDGANGRNGAPGPQGVKGADGLIGPAGAQGERGAVGERGVPGIPGPMGPQGPQGPQGDVGPVPRHEWRGTSLRFEQASGKWGQWVDLRGQDGATITHGARGGGIGPQGPQGASGGGGGTSDGSVPYFVPAGETFTVPIYRQALFARTIDVEGLVELDGDLVLVN
jgi:hypothetical protein